MQSLSDFHKNFDEQGCVIFNAIVPVLNLKNIGQTSKYKNLGMQFFKKIVRNCVMGNFTIPHLIPLLTRNIDHCLVFVLEQSNHRDTP